MKRIQAFLLTVVLALTMCAPAFAAVEDTGFSDVAANAWYADAAQYVRDNGIMSGTSSTTFSPNATMTRAMLATVLYRAAGSPAVSGTADFLDVRAGAYYANAAAWASANGIVTGYGNGLFGSNDPVTREQIAAILWRYQGSPAVTGTADFTDRNAISAYAAPAAAWAKENGIVNGLSDGRFAPKSNATRAQVAVILRNLLSSDTPDPDSTPSESHKVLVAYFSATGSTKAIAEHLQTALNADLYEIVPQQPYTAADLDYNTDCRANREQNDASARPAISGSADVSAYDTVFIGYPIWWGQAPKIIYTFLESHDFSGKTIVPFCTSGSSSIGGSLSGIRPLAPNANWLSGQRFSGGASQSAVQSWVDSLGLEK